MELFCPRCGAQVPGAAAFCASCGMRMTPTAPQTQMPPPPQHAPPQQPYAQPPPPAYGPSPQMAPKKGPGLMIVVIVVVAILIIAAIGIFLLMSGGGGSSMIQGSWIRTGYCGETWRLEFQGFGSLKSTETEYDAACNPSPTTEYGSWSSQEFDDRVEAWFWDVYRGTVWKSDPASLTVHKFDSAGNHLNTWEFTRA